MNGQSNGSMNGQSNGSFNRPFNGSSNHSTTSMDLSPMEAPLERLRELNLESKRQYEREKLLNASEYPSPPNSRNPIPSSIRLKNNTVDMTERQQQQFRILPSVDVSSLDLNQSTPTPRFSNWNRIYQSPTKAYVTPSNSSPDTTVPPPPMMNRKGPVSPTTSNQSSPATITSSLSKLSPPDDVATSPSSRKP